MELSLQCRPTRQFKGLDIEMYLEFPALVVRSLDIARTAVFAVSGALAPAQVHQTFLTFAFFAVVTGIGGIMLSQLLMRVPVVWIHHPTNIVVCVIVAPWTTPSAGGQIAQVTGLTPLESRLMAQ